MNILRTGGAINQYGQSKLTKMPKSERTKLQIQAITKQINNGKVKNVYAAVNKINSLKKKMQVEAEAERWNSFLAQ